MWFGSQKDSTRRSPDRGGALKVNARLSDQNARRRYRVRALVLAPLAAVALALGVWQGALKAGEVLFWKNDRYKLKTLDIRLDGQVITAQHVREYSGLAEGTNLFAVNICELRKAFLAKTPIVRSMAVYRHLPDTIEFDISERATVARIGRWRVWGVDREGWVFNLRSGGRELPLVTGYTGQTLRPGMRVDQPVMNAIAVLDVCSRTRIGDRVKIVSIDVSAKEYLDVYLAAGERIRLAWEGMGEDTPASRRDLEKKLTVAANTLAASEKRGRRIANLDLTFHDQYIPAQEY